MNRPFLQPTGIDPQPAELMDLRAVLRTGWRALPSVIVAVAVALTVAIVYLAFTERTYYSASVLQMSGARIQLGSEVSPAPAAMETDAEILTQIEVIRSASMARRVAERLQLADEPAFLDRPAPWLDRSKEWVKVLLGMEQPQEHPPSKVLNSQERLGFAAARLQRDLHVSRVGRSYAVEVGFSSDSPERARAIAEAYTNSYIEHRKVANSAGAAQAASWLRERADILEARLAESDREVERVRAERGLTAAAGTSLIERQLAELSTQLGEAGIETARARAELRAYETLSADVNAPAAPLSSINESVVQGADESWRELRVRYEELSARRGRLAEQFGSDHPQVKALDAAIAETGGMLMRETEAATEVARAALMMSEQREAALESQLSALSERAVKANESLGELNGLMQRSAALSTLYEKALLRYEEASQRDAFAYADVSVLSPATTPKNHATPRTLPSLAFALIAGIMAGGLGAVMRAVPEQPLRTGEDVRTALDLPFLGYLPSRRFRLPGRARLAAALEADALSATAAVIVASGRLTSNIAPIEKQPQVVALASCGAPARRGPDASVLSSYLSRAGERVELIDAAGSATGEAPVSVHIAQAQSIEPPPSVVLVSLPPLELARVALGAVPLMDGIVLVLRWDRVRPSEVRRVLATLPHTAPRILGVLLSDAAPVRVRRHLGIGEREFLRTHAPVASRRPSPTDADTPTPSSREMPQENSTRSTECSRSQMSRILRAKEAQARLGIGKTKFFEDIRKGLLPKPVRLGGVVGYLEEEIDAVIEKLRADRDRDFKDAVSRQPADPPL